MGMPSILYGENWPLTHRFSKLTKWY